MAFIGPGSSASPGNLALDAVLPADMPPGTYHARAEFRMSIPDVNVVLPAGAVVVPRR